jgi:hypothetical protein
MYIDSTRGSCNTNLMCKRGRVGRDGHHITRGRMADLTSHTLMYKLLSLWNNGNGMCVPAIERATEQSHEARLGYAQWAFS